MMQYNFYNKLILEIDANNHKGYIKYFNNEYLRITSNNSRVTKSTPNISVKIVKNLPKTTKKDIKKSVCYKKLFTYNYVIKNLNSNNVEIYFQSHFIDKIYMNAIGVFLQAQVIEPVMYLKLLKNDILLMHASGVEKDNNAYLFPAYGGTGKTTFSISLLGHGYKLLGDDLLFVDVDNGVVSPYARPMHLFTYNINNLNGAKVPTKYRVAIYTKNVLRFFLEKILRTEMLISTRVHADEIFDSNPFGKSAEYNKVFFLVKSGPKTKKVKISKNNIQKLAVEVAQSADLNNSLKDIMNEKDFTVVQDLEIKVIKKLLSSLDYLTYLNTRKLDLKNLEQFIKSNMD